MPPQIRRDPAAAAPAADAPATRRPGEPSGFGGLSAISVFGPTIFDALADAPAPAPPLLSLRAARFDVCHAGVVLRALAFVHVVVAIGALFGSGPAPAHGAAAWAARLAAGSGVALPALLLWLLTACLARRLLGALSPLWQGAAVVALGAVSGAFGAALTALLGDADGGGGFGGLGGFSEAALAGAVACAAAGAAFAGVGFVWLGLRARALLPADTTARLAELQARIRPHFLFNTLNTALALVRHDPARAEGVLEDLAELFRVAISDSPAVSTLDAEIELARRYLAIEQLRFGTRLRVRWEIDPAAGSARLPPLLLQPLVENAVRHGVEPSADGATLRIRTQVRFGRAVVAIANSVPPQASRPGHGMALRNVRERLRLMHDVAAYFDTQLDHGVFRVRIGLPL